MRAPKGEVRKYIKKKRKRRWKKEREKNNGYAKAHFSRIHKGSKNALVGDSLLTFKISERIKRRNRPTRH
jgi:hypothetical protein